MEGESVSMLTSVGDALTEVISWVGEVVTALTGASGALNALLPLMALGISISVLMLGVKAIKSFAWGT